MLVICKNAAYSAFNSSSDRTYKSSAVAVTSSYLGGEKLFLWLFLHGRNQQTTKTPVQTVKLEVA